MPFFPPERVIIVVVVVVVVVVALKQAPMRVPPDPASVPRAGEWLYKITLAGTDARAKYKE